MEFATHFPFLRLAVECATHDVRGLRELARVSLRSPGVDVVLVRLVRLPRSLRLGLMWARADAVIDCVADAIEAYQLSQDENYDTGDPDAECEASVDDPRSTWPFDDASVVSRLDAEREAVDAGLWRITRLTGPRELADALPGDLAWVETADDSTGANARPVHFLQGRVGPVWRPLGSEVREKLAHDRMVDIRGLESEWGVHDRLCVARVRAGLSRAQAARQLAFRAITANALQAIEEGDHDPTPADLRKLASLYDVSVEWLRGESAPSPMRAAVERSGLSEPDKATPGDMLDAMAPAPQPRVCQTCQTAPILHVSEPGAGWVVMCPGCGEETGEHCDSADAIEAWNRDLIWLPPKPAASTAGDDAHGVPLPCPFCGSASPARSRYGDGDEFALIECGACGGQYDGHWADGWTEWNRRAGVHSDAPAGDPSAPPSLHTLWGRAASLGYPRRPKRWWIEVQRAQEQGHDISDVLREAARDLDAHKQPADDGAVEPDPDGWRDVAAITPEEWAAWRWWEWRYSATASPWRQSSREAWSVPALGQARRVPPLEWHEMGGERWTDARDVTQAMIDAWPVWEVDRGDFVAVVPGAGVTVSGALAGQWRPLRLPGMSTDQETIGEIASEDMRPEHFKRVDEWQFRDDFTAWQSWTVRRHGTTASLMSVHVSDRNERWRPAVFGRSG